MAEKPLVLILGATGLTGVSLVNGLLASGNFRLAALMRSASLSKPAVQKLREQGVEIRVGDAEDSVEKHKENLVGVEVLISVVPGRAWCIDAQRNIIIAAKEVGVKRVLPCEFGTPGAKGFRELFDHKLAIREYIQEHGIPYTFIDVGWWMQLYLPLPLRSKAPDDFRAIAFRLIGGGEARNIVTNCDQIGVYVARIIADPRTLNHAVIIWEDEVSRLEAQDIGERVSGDGDALKAHRIYIDREDFLKTIEANKTDPTTPPFIRVWDEYTYSTDVLHENTLENAKKLGYLDVRELYPDILPTSFEEFAKGFYNADPYDQWTP